MRAQYCCFSNHALFVQERTVSVIRCHTHNSKEKRTQFRVYASKQTNCVDTDNRVAEEKQFFSRKRDAQK